MTPTLTTPPKNTGRIRAFLKRISSERAIFLSLTVMDGMEVAQCHMNVDRLVICNGGKAVYGWVIWESSELLEAEFHCVWQSPDGADLLDVTPRLHNQDKILFLPDPIRSFDWSTLETYTSVCLNRRTEELSYSFQDETVPHDRLQFCPPNSDDRLLRWRQYRKSPATI